MITVLLHLYHHDLWPEINNYLKKLPPHNLYVNVVDLISVPGKVIKSVNQGRDCGGNLRLIGSWLNDGAPGDLILQCHSKKKPRWRKQLFEPLFNHQASNLFKNPKVGMVGSKVCFRKRNDINSAIYANYCKRFNLQSYSPMPFFGGTVFYVRSCIYKDFFSKFNPVELANELEIEPITEPSRTHAWERLFGTIVVNYNYELTPIEPCKML